LQNPFFYGIINIRDVKKIYPCSFNAIRPGGKKGRKRPEGGAEQL